MIIQTATDQNPTQLNPTQQKANQSKATKSGTRTDNSAPGSRGGAREQSARLWPWCSHDTSMRQLCAAVGQSAIQLHVSLPKQLSGRHSERQGLCGTTTSRPLETYQSTVANRFGSFCTEERTVRRSSLLKSPEIVLRSFPSPCVSVDLLRGYRTPSVVHIVLSYPVNRSVLHCRSHPPPTAEA